MNTMNRCALLALALGFSSGAAQARRPKPSQATVVAPASSRAGVPLVTRDNFVSLSIFTSGGIANLSTNVTVSNNIINRYSPGGSAVSGGWGQGGSGPGPSGFGNGFGNGFGYPPGGSSTVAASILSNNQLNVLLRALDEARFPALTGKYRQKNLADGINETVALTVSDEANRDRTFTIENYGDTAPRAYYEMMNRLRAFIALKFPDPPARSAPAPALAAPPR